MVPYGVHAGTPLYQHVALCHTLFFQYQDAGMRCWDLTQCDCSGSAQNNDFSEKVLNAYNSTHDLLKVSQADGYKETIRMCKVVSGSGLAELPTILEGNPDVVLRLATLYAQSNVMLQPFAALVGRIVHTINAEITHEAHHDTKGAKDVAQSNIASLKGLGRCVEKLILRPGKLPTDVVRAQVEVSEMMGIAVALKHLYEHPGIILHKFKDRFTQPNSGWADVSVVLSLGEANCDGAVAELQLVHERLMTVREQWGGHDAYAGDRYGAELAAFMVQQKTANKPGKKWTKVDVQKVLARKSLPYTVRKRIEAEENAGVPVSAPQEAGLLGMGTPGAGIELTPGAQVELVRLR